MNDWPQQIRFVNETLTTVRRGKCRRTLVTSPTGTGKSRSVCQVISELVRQGWYAVLYSNRNLLVEQLQETLTSNGIEFGVRAAGYSQDEDFWPVQIASLPTEASMTLRKGEWEIHGKGRKCIAITDEAHLNAGPKAGEIQTRHLDDGHHWLGVTATPVDLAHMYDELIVAGTLAEGFECGALMRAHQYAPDQPDLRSFKRALKTRMPDPGSDFSENQQRKLMGAVNKEGEADERLQKLYGRVWENYTLENPDRRAGILFAGGVRESIWWAQQFTEHGVKAAHLDGEHVWIDGELQPTSPTLRRQVLDDSRDGKIKMLCNRFVLREGVDAPWLGHGIFATCFGAVQTYIQSGGRLLRYHPSLERVTVQDHGGNCHRFGSLNADREWFIDSTAESIYGVRANRLRRGDPRERQAFTCPQCHRLWTAGRHCNPKWGGCGYVIPEKAKLPRRVITFDGVLELRESDVFDKRTYATKPDQFHKWLSMYYAAVSKRWEATFAQAIGMYFQKYSIWPNPRWPLMPRDPHDEYRKVVDVPLDNLIWDPDDPDLYGKVKGFITKNRPETINAAATEPAAAPALAGQPDPFA